MKKYLEMRDDAIVLPAHYVTWKEANGDLIFGEKLGVLKKSNPIFDLKQEAEFVGFVLDNMRESPEVYSDIKLVNRGLMSVTDEEADIMDLGKNECAASHYETN